MHRPVSLLFLFPALGVGGAERQLATLVRRLDRSRFRPLVACQHGLGPVAAEISAAGVPVHLLSGARRFDPLFVARTAALVRREKVRLVATHGFSTGVVGRLAARLGGAPVRVLLEHATGERDMSPTRHRLNRLLAPLATAWVAVAAGQLDYMTRAKRIPPRKIHVIHNGIDPAPYRLPEAVRAAARARVRAEFGIPERAPVAGSLAVLRPEKDLRTFVRAARIALERLPETRFLVVGEGPQRAELGREIASLGLEGRVSLAGWRSDVPDVLAAFDVSVLCSTDVETLPVAFLESMAAGLPLVGTRVGGLPELVEEGSNGRLVPPGDPQALAAAICSVLEDPDRARRWGSASRARVESEFHCDRMVRAYEELFVRLLGEARVRVAAGGA